MLGMIIMTNALQQLAGSALRTALIRFTKSPTSGAITGAISTAVLQSSSATTVAAVGFVGAGIISFSESLGIIFGANIGTTITGWMVALLGFKLKLGTVLLPVIFIGALMKLFGKGRLASAGLVLAGFGLIFVGIGQMQFGMAELEQYITPQQFPDDDLLGRLQLVAIGIAITLVTQSSSAGVATAITALYAGAINFNQAAALVIGMDVGTTITALMVTVGGSLGARRTGYSHVVYNLFTAIGALILLTPFTQAYQYFFPGQLQANGEIALVAFHTVFNCLGVFIVLPFTKQFALMMMTLVGGKAPRYTDTLDKSLVRHPDVALTATNAALLPQLVDLLDYIKYLFNPADKDAKVEFSQLEMALDQTHEYLDLIHLNKQDKQNWPTLVSLIHLLDHMQRLHERCLDKDIVSINSSKDKTLISVAAEITYTIDLVIDAIELKNFTQANVLLLACKEHNVGVLEQYRDNVMNQIAKGEKDVPQGSTTLESVRDLSRLLNNLQRVSYYLLQIHATKLPEIKAKS
ncbi:Na/Pi cotransporter family protein [Thalassotalea sp. HSM 43]|uniref:Na/Pi cotransporter family protein n=1 Tax=Thalassotalea sp. HSM 43 TaxID=2552945 RepID=UPI001E639993|nr:Na/Pi symporter [Thalassotalea sp. HSM 43]